MTQTSLYRHFDGDILLYVGISVEPIFRTSQHRQKADWFGCVDKITIERFESRKKALEAERKAVEIEKPLFNVLLQASKGSRWVVFHPFSNRVDGVYFRGISAYLTYKYFKETYPKEKFEFVRLAPGDSTVGLDDLRTINFDEWLEHKEAQSDEHAMLIRIQSEGDL